MGRSPVCLHLLALFGLDIVPEHAFCQIALHPLPCHRCLDTVGEVAARFAKAPNERCRIEPCLTAATQGPFGDLLSDFAARTKRSAVEPPSSPAVETVVVDVAFTLFRAFFAFWPRVKKSLFGNRIGPLISSCAALQPRCQPPRRACHRTLLTRHGSDTDREASNDCAANKFGRWLPDCNHSADDFIGEQRKNALLTRRHRQAKCGADAGILHSWPEAEGQGPWHILSGYDLEFAGVSTRERVRVMLEWFGRRQTIALPINSVVGCLIAAEGLPLMLSQSKSPSAPNTNAPTW
jgi:hypothetical protein